MICISSKGNLSGMHRITQGQSPPSQNLFESHSSFLTLDDVLFSSQDSREWRLLQNPEGNWRIHLPQAGRSLPQGNLNCCKSDHAMVGQKLSDNFTFSPFSSITCKKISDDFFSWLLITRTLANSNLPSRWLKVIFISFHAIFYIILSSITRTSDNSNLLLKVRVIRSRL